MGYNLIKGYDTYCSRCQNWASGDLGSMNGNKWRAEKMLKSAGWKVIDGKTVCNYCITGERR